MALQMNISEADSAVGSAFPTAYARIVQLRYGVDPGTIDIVVEVHASQAARQAKKNPVAGLSFQAVSGVGDMVDVDLAASPPIKRAAYNYLKTLPEFAVSTDV